MLDLLWFVLRRMPAAAQAAAHLSPLRLWAGDAVSTSAVPPRMAHPDGNARRRWDLLVFACLVRSCWCVPFYAAFASVLEENQQSSGLTWAELGDRFIDAVFLADVALQFFTVPYDMLHHAQRRGDAAKDAGDAERASSANHTVTHGAVAWRYVTTWFLFDLLASMPLDLMYTIPEHTLSVRLQRAAHLQAIQHSAHTVRSNHSHIEKLDHTHHSNHTHIEKLEYEVHNPYGKYILRFNTLLRLVHVRRYLRAFARADGLGVRLRYFFRMKHVHIELTKYFIIVLCFWHFFACFFWIVAKGAKGGVQGHAWYQELKHRYRTDPSQTQVTMYLVASYHAMLMMVTVDNSFRPENDVERVFTLVMAICGTFLVLYCVSVVCKLVHEANGDLTMLDSHLDVITEIAKNQKLSKGTLLPALRYLRLVHDMPRAKLAADKAWMVANLTSSQRTEILLRMHREVCRDCAYLNSASFDGNRLTATDIAEVLHACVWRVHLPGEALTNAGRRPSALIIVLSGAVRMTATANDRAKAAGARLGTGETVGDALVLFVAQKLRRDPAWRPRFPSPPLAFLGTVAESLTETYELDYRALQRLWTHVLPLEARRAWVAVAVPRATATGFPASLAQAAEAALHESEEEEWLLVDGEEAVAFGGHL